MKLSILIPVYNYDISELVTNLYQQLQSANTDFEILVLDDASTNEKILNSNREIQKFNEVIYRELKQNVGSAKVRNSLFQEAKGNWLLFLDADVLPVYRNFISNYLLEIEKDDADLISGGIEMRLEDNNGSNRLRWKYGNENEKLSGKLPHVNEALGVRGANFLVKQQLFSPDFFLKLPHKYGFVDTMFGLRFKEDGNKIKLIDNPVYHIGLESAETFLSKTKLAIKNAIFLNENYPKLANEIRLIRIYKRLQKMGFLPIIRSIFKVQKSKWEKNLYSENPSLKIFQLYKIGYMSWAALEKRESSSDS